MLRLVVLLALFSCTAGWSSFWYRMYGCRPPRTLKARIELTGYDNDRNNDGMTDNSDFERDLVDYDYDGDVSTIKLWELVFHWRCVYGWDEDYGRFFFNNLDRNKDGVVTMEGDLNAPLSFTGENFRKRNLERFQNYCKERDNKPTDCYKLELEKNNLLNFGNYSLPSLKPKSA